MPSPKEGQRVRYLRKWTVGQKVRIMNEIADARESGVRGAIQRVLDKYLLRTTFPPEWRKSLIRHGLWDNDRNRPKNKE